MSYLDHDGLAYFKSKLDRTFIADIVFDDGDILLYGGDGTLLKTVVQEGTVTQKKSAANKEYPILLCWDADAEEDQTMKTVWYGLDARINPKFGYLYARRYYTEHPSYERTNAPTARTEWHHVFTDAVSAPMGEVYEYLDRNSDGGEHRMELRLYGNPLSQYVDTPNHNEATDAVSIGVGATKGDKLTFFGYCPSTPIYLENGSTMRKSTVRGDQYGKDIITRDWLNLNGSITGLVHTYMDETIDGYKTFLKTVTIDSGNDNAKAGLDVQGDVNIDSGDNTKPSNLYVQGNSHIHGNEDIDGNLNVDGTSTLDGNVHMKHNLDVDGNLNVDGTSDQHGNVHMYNNLDVDGNANTDGNQTIGGTLTVTGKITGNGGAEISGGSGLKVNGNETVTGNLGVGGTINKVSGNTTQEYVTYITNQADTRKNIAQNLVDTSRGVGYDASTGKIYAKISTDDGLKFNSNGTIAVDFSQMPTDKFEALVKGLKMLIPLSSNLQVHVNNTHANKGDSIVDGRGTENKPFNTIQAAVNFLVSNYSIGRYNPSIVVHPGTYDETVSLPDYSTGGGTITVKAFDPTNKPIIQKNNTGSYRLVSCTGSTWNFKYFKLINHPSDTNQSPNAAYLYPGVAGAYSGGVLNISGCECEMTCNAANSSRLYVEMFSAESDGVISFNIDSTYATTLKYSKGSNTDVNTFLVINVDGGNIRLTGTNEASDKWEILCEGDCDTFIFAHHTSLVGPRGSGLKHAKFVTAPNKTCTGKKHAAATGSGINNNSGDDYPGDVTGTEESATYSWYR